MKRKPACYHTVETKEGGTGGGERNQPGLVGPARRCPVGPARRRNSKQSKLHTNKICQAGPLVAGLTMKHGGLCIIHLGFVRNFPFFILLILSSKDRSRTNIETLKKIDIELTLIIEYVFNVFIFIIDIVSNLMFMI